MIKVLKSCLKKLRPSEFSAMLRDVTFWLWVFIYWLVHATGVNANESILASQTHSPNNHYLLFRGY